jgi:hypothetical protein
MKIKGLKRVVRGLRHTVKVVDAPPDRTVQVFVLSYRSGLYYPQDPVVDGTTEVVLGNAEHNTGKYSVVAVALDREAEWGPKMFLPTGERSNVLKVRRFGRN